ncbi:MAG: hypothetical protein ACM359_21305 [Bacillota bacterium]
MHSESLQPRLSTVVLDYSQGALRRVGPSRWLRLFWSHRARLELAQTASCTQGLLVLAAISLIAGLLSTTHLCIHSLIVHAMDPHCSLRVLRNEFSAHWLAVIGTSLIVAPLCFAVLAGLLLLLSRVWTGLMRPGERWSQTFPVLSVGCVPLLWFFVLLQLESVAPFAARAGVWGGAWNPVTNLVRFISLMIGMILLAMWIVDGMRMYYTLRRRERRSEASLMHRA